VLVSQGARVSVRVVSAEAPHAAAHPVAPTLEDAYLWIVGSGSPVAPAAMLRSDVTMTKTENRASNPAPWQLSLQYCSAISQFQTFRDSSFHSRLDFFRT
jgi:hypothetical protein